MAAPVTIFGVQGEALSSIAKNIDSAQPNLGAPARFGARGEHIVQNVWNGMQQLAAEGSYYIASTATPGTGITLSVATGTSFADTQALLCINNTDSVGTQGKVITLDFICIVVTTVPTNATSVHLAHRIDSQTRGTTGTQLGAVGTSPRQTSMNYSGSAVGQVFALGGSAVSVAASGSVRNVGRNVLRSQIPVIQDCYFIKFGSAEMSASPNIGATTAQSLTFYAPPVQIGPGQSYVCNEWAVARSAATSGELIVGWIER